MERQVKIGLIGCGNISRRYIKGCGGFDMLEIVACADILPERAQALADECGIRACSTEALLADPEIEIVVNLTLPASHAEVSLTALRAGKHVYSEKPLAIQREKGAKILDEAAERGLMVGCAPDTFLGGGLQTCRKLLDDGWIGEPVAATAFMMSHGPESWHPNPAFFYRPGAGPMFDMGPYYLTALIHLLGPIQRVTGSARRSFTERVATSRERMGERIPVQTSTHVAGVLDFVAGPVATLITSFDVWASSLPRIEIYGSEGTLMVPDPNTFGGPVRLRRAGAESWSEIPLTHSAEVGRGIGVADMAYALRTERRPRASGEMAYHVLDAMQAFQEASDEGAHVQLSPECDRPEPLPLGLLPGRLDR